MRTFVVHEIRSVIVALRHNIIWASDRLDLPDIERPLIDALKRCREKVAAHPYEDLSGFSALDIVAPLLVVVRSPQASGPFTLAALRAIKSLLQRGALASHLVHAPDAANEVIEAVAACRFEQTDAQLDEVVLAELMDVLVCCIRGPLGQYVGDEAVWDALQTCFVNRNLAVHSPMLNHIAETALEDILCYLFHGLPSMLAADDGDDTTAHDRSHGLPCLVKVFGFLCSQLLLTPPSDNRSAKANNENLRLLCLRLLRQIIDISGPALGQVHSIVALVHDDLSRALLVMTEGGLPVEILSEALGVIATLWRHLRFSLKIQFEALLNSTFLRVLHQLDEALRQPVAAEETLEPVALPSGYQVLEQEIIIEVLGDLMSDPHFLPDVLINYDCDVKRSDICGPLVRTLVGVILDAHQRSNAAALQVLCLRALLNGVKGLTAGLDSQSAQAEPEREQQHAALLPWEVPAAGAASPALPNFWTLRTRKAELGRGAAIFHKKPRLGLDYLQGRQLLPKPLTPEAVALFLRSAPGLDKVAVGEYLGKMGTVEVDETGRAAHVADTVAFHAATLESFVKSFDFSGQSILPSLRMFLAAFRLPHEAQEIDRVLEAFAKEAYASCEEGSQGLFATPDVPYLLSFSIIMLNTDLHNPNIKPERRMTLADFKRSNTNYGQEISQGKDLPSELLEEIYKAIQEDQIITSDDDGPAGAITRDRWRDLMRQSAADPSLCNMTMHRSERNSFMTGSALLGHTRTHLIHILWFPVFAAATGTLTDRQVCRHLRTAAAAGAASEKAEETEGADEANEDGVHAASATALGYAVDMTLSLAKWAASEQETHIIDSIVTTLVGVTGLVKSPSGHGPHLNTEEGAAEELAPIRKFLSNPAAQMACVTVFGIMHRLGDQMRASWRPAFRLLFVLRDFLVLPKALLKESDPDLLPLQLREAFNARILALQAKRIGHMERSGSPGFFSGITGLLFGADLAGESGYHAYESLWNDTIDNEHVVALEGTPSLDAPATAKNLRLACRHVLSGCGIEELVPMTRYLGTEALLSFVRALVHAVQASVVSVEGEPDSDRSAGGRAPDTNEIGDIVCPWEGAKADDPLAAELAESAREAFRLLRSATGMVRLPHLSRPSLALAEVLLAEVVLRNRDRAVAVWLVISEHYKYRTHCARDLSFGVEKAFTGLLRIIYRLVSRDVLVNEALYNFAWVMAPHADSRVAAGLVDHTASALWMTVSTNVAALATISAGTWRVVFELLRSCVSATPHAAIRAFECLCALVKEAKLKDKVPIGVLGAITAFADSTVVDEKLLLGAVELLETKYGMLSERFHDLLESRRDVGQTPSFSAELCAGEWLPLLQATAVFCRHRSDSIRGHAVQLLAQILLDPRMEGVQSAYMITAFKDVVIPVYQYQRAVDAPAAPATDELPEEAEYEIVEMPDSKSKTELPTDFSGASAEIVVMSATLECFQRYGAALQQHPDFGALSLEMEVLRNRAPSAKVVDAGAASSAPKDEVEQPEQQEQQEQQEQPEQQEKPAQPAQQEQPAQPAQPAQPEIAVASELMKGSKDLPETDAPEKDAEEVEAVEGPEKVEGVPGAEVKVLDVVNAAGEEGAESNAVGVQSEAQADEPSAVPLSSASEDAKEAEEGRTPQGDGVNETVNVDTENTDDDADEV